MKLCVILLAAALICLIAARLFGQASSPVSVEMAAPTTGQVLSNTITLMATASSIAAPIQRVEFYIDGVLFKTVSANKPSTPGNLLLIKQ